MDFLTWGRNPWGQQILTHVSWDLLWASLFAGVMFLVAHASYMVLSAHHKYSEAETDALEAVHKNLPAMIERHTLMARLFHWVMAASMFVLLFSAFLPIVGVKFAWVQWHWIAGLVLTGSIIYHIIHATFFLDFWSIWVGPRDIPEIKAEMMRELGREVSAPKPAKYPMGNRLYHLAIVVVGLTAAISGIFMMSRVRTGRLHQKPVPAGRYDLGLHLRAARPGRRRSRRPHHRPRLLRRPSGEVVDHQGDDLRHDHAPPVSRAPRPRRWNVKGDGGTQPAGRA